MTHSLHISLPLTLIEAYHNKDLIVVDVRTPTEFIHGHIGQAVNLPFDQFNLFIDEIKQWNKPVITCSANGIRALKAAKILRQHDIEAINGDRWQNLQALISEEKTSTI